MGDLNAWNKMFELKPWYLRFNLRFWWTGYKKDEPKNSDRRVDRKKRGEENAG